jgi:hypothetical protein
MSEKTLKQIDKELQTFRSGTTPMVQYYSRLSSKVDLMNCSIKAIIKYHKSCQKAAEQLMKDLEKCHP